MEFDDNIRNSLFKNFIKEIPIGNQRKHSFEFEDLLLGDLDLLYNKIFFKIDKIQMCSHVDWEGKVKENY